MYIFQQSVVGIVSVFVLIGLGPRIRRADVQPIKTDMRHKIGCIVLVENPKPEAKTTSVGVVTVFVIVVKELPSFGLFLCLDQKPCLAACQPSVVVGKVPFAIGVIVKLTFSGIDPTPRDIIGGKGSN